MGFRPLFSPEHWPASYLEQWIDTFLKLFQRWGMRIDSVRELKANCLKQHLEALPSMKELWLSGKSRRRTRKVHPTIAFGIRPLGKANFHLAIRVQNRALLKSVQLASFVERARGEVDVRYIGRVNKLNGNPTPFQNTQRPLIIGASVANVNVTVGTIGCFVTPRAGGAPGILSNNHVLANEGKAAKGSEVCQPAPSDNGDETDTVATLTNFVPLTLSGINLVDAAVATIAPGIQFNATLLTGLGNLNPTPAPSPVNNATVYKIGRSSGLQKGIIQAAEISNVHIDYDMGNLRFDDQIEIENAPNGDAFAQPGDSGSLVVNQNLQPIGLLSFGSDQGGIYSQGPFYANPISAVFDKLQVNLTATSNI